jgi:hypothetical protein
MLGFRVIDVYELDLERPETAQGVEVEEACFGEFGPVEGDEYRWRRHLRGTSWSG